MRDKEEITITDQPIENLPRPLHQYTARERHLLKNITGKIVAYLDPLIIYCITSEYRTDTERSCLTAKKDMEEWSFECDLLIVVRDKCVVSSDTMKQITDATAEFGTVVLIIHSLSEFTRQLKEGDVLSTAVHRDAAVWYEKDDTRHQLVNGS